MQDVFRCFSEIKIVVMQREKHYTVNMCKFHSQNVVVIMKKNSPAV